jgi:hypothetical protein
MNSAILHIVHVHTPAQFVQRFGAVQLITNAKDSLPDWLQN